MFDPLPTFNINRSDKTFWTGKRRLFAGAAPGRRPGRLPGGHVHDLASLKKAITLCADCRPKFNASRCDYVTKKNLPIVRDRCDGCQEFTRHGHLLVHRSLADLT